MKSLATAPHSPPTALLSPVLEPTSRARLAAWAVDLALVTMMIQLGASVFEHGLVDPRWPDNLALIQPERGGLDRKLFWIPAHIAATVTLPLALWGHWRRPTLRRPLLIAVGLYLALRVWTMAYFVPEALAFEQATPDALDVDAARRWTRLSLLRLPMVIGIVVALGAVLSRSMRVSAPRA